MPDQFYNHDVLRVVKNSNRQFWNGYLGLFDIKDSTKRKKAHPERWYAQTETFYKAVRQLSVEIHSGVPDIYGEMDEEDKCSIVKFIGDAGLIFFPHSYASKPDIEKVPPRAVSLEFIKYISMFRNSTHNQTDLGGLRLKTVAAYLTGLRPIRFSSRPTAGGSPDLDVLGRGIDFCFRLEKFADDSYLVANQMDTSKNLAVWGVI